MARGTLFIIPITIADTELSQVLPSHNTEVIKPIRFFAVEKIKTARQFLRKMDREFPIDDSTFYEQDKHDDYSYQKEVIRHLLDGQDVGLISESGYPAVADPGYLIVAEAQRNGVKVVPLVGPSSLLMALAASGMNGQGFTFNGYLPVKEPDRSKQLQFIIGLVQKTSFSQIFIETPYRNEVIFKDFIKHCPSDMKVCVALDITGPNETIVTQSIADWKKNPFRFDKTPCVFILGV
ncbi:MAG: SAM-dependent methyltransferase [Crocinitomicaceae bacterium]|nr:SAM-dependent methyltransferase [Crocinitomicaceae bacterium]